MKYLSFFILLLFFACETPINDTHLPPPTDGTIVIEKGQSSKHHQRKAWIESMHKTAPNHDWREIEYQNQFARHQSKKNSLEQRGEEEELADGQLRGTWKERGSANQAGNVVTTAYDAERDEIYLISGGGTLWKGKRDGSNWEVVNDDFQFRSRALQLIEKDGQQRILTMLNKIVHYSDDDGLTWTPASGLETPYDNWGDRREIKQLDEGMYIAIQEWNEIEWESYVGIYRAMDAGESFTKIHDFGEGDLRKIAFTQPHHTNTFYLIETLENETKTYKLNAERQFELLHTADFSIGDERANLAATLRGDSIWLYTYNEDNELFISKNEGETWEKTSDLPASPWSVGVYISPSNPDMLYMGEVECHRSKDAGQTWERVNGWGAYYSDVEFMLHADMMYFEEFETAEGIPFLLISNHGGLSISYDYTQTNRNISLQGLNVCQYYSAKTLPANTDFVYAGTQDQGFQRAFDNDADVTLNFEQVISGDYGHIVFSDNGTKLWTVYPGGWVTYYDNPESGYLTASYDLESEDETVWIPPLVASPNPVDQQIYMAGGNVDGGAGSHIIELVPNGENIETYQYPFDFKAASDGEVSAIEISPLNNRLWYVGTTNGRFFYSENGGNTWEQSFVLVPEPNYLYGSTILASKIDENTVYMGGSGYEDAPVYVSYNNGRTFAPMRDGLPPTMVFELVANADETMLFAATEAGPYVYVLETEQWYDMHGMGAPTQTYWSVEFLDDKNLVRFGTYGRGIWDFQIADEMVAVNTTDVANLFSLYPNPASDFIIIETPSLNPANQVEIYDTKGKLVRQAALSKGNNRLSLKSFSSGFYIVKAYIDDKIQTKKIILQ